MPLMRHKAAGLLAYCIRIQLGFHYAHIFKIVALGAQALRVAGSPLFVIVLKIIVALGALQGSGWQARAPSGALTL